VVGGDLKMSFHGARIDFNNFMMDGTSINSVNQQAIGGTSGQALGVETIREGRLPVPEPQLQPAWLVSPSALKLGARNAVGDTQHRPLPRDSQWLVSILLLPCTRPCQSW
jgi:hypothetical protein